MYRRFHDRFGTAGVVIAVVALIAALGGSAIAAGGALTGKQKKEVTKIAKKYAGKAGAPGAAGTNGTNGIDGAPGLNGKDGKNGEDGNTVLSGFGAPNDTVGKDGDFYIDTNSQTIYGPKEAGEWPTPGTPLKGDPWTPDGTLPDGASLTGTYTPNKLVEFEGFEVPGLMAEGESYLSPISFSLPLSSAPQFIYVPHIGTGYGTATGCPGVVGGVPQADSGKFCVYAARIDLFGAPPSASVTAYPPSDLVVPVDPGADPGGALLRVKCTTGSCAGAGVWAVTGQ